MSVKIEYTPDSRLLISGLECDCGSEHNELKQDIYVGNNLIGNLPLFIARRGLGTHCVLVADKNTYKVAGEAVSKILAEAGFDVIECVIMRDGNMEPDEVACGEVLLSVQPETEFLVAVGSGSITDTVRINAMRCKLPFVSVGTAPSMDGYTSVVAPLLLRGEKIHRAAVCPEIIVSDIDILRTAPLDMVASGVGDVLGKYIAKADWIIGSIINDEIYCPLCGDIVTDSVNKLVENIDEIKAKSEKGIRILIEALLLAGVTVTIAGHTRAVASIEHNIAHFWDMRQLADGKRPPSHGAAVGVATLMAWRIFEKFANADLSKLDLDDIKARRLLREERAEWMRSTYGEAIGNSIMSDNEGDFLSWGEQKRRIERAQTRFMEIKRVIDELPPYEKVEDCMRRLGAPLTAADIGIGDRLRNVAMHCGKDYRTRYTIFKTLDECGLLKEYLSDYPI